MFNFSNVAFLVLIEIFCHTSTVTALNISNVILVILMLNLFIASASEGGCEEQLLKWLFLTVKEAVEKMPGWPDVSPLLIIDDLSILTSLGCKDYEVSVFFQELRAMLCPHGGTIVSLIHTEHNDIQAESRSGSLYHHIGHQSDMILLVQPLKTGYCRDLTGEVCISYSSAFMAM